MRSGSVIEPIEDPGECFRGLGHPGGYGVPGYLYSDCRDPGDNLGLGLPFRGSYGGYNGVASGRGYRRDF
ncbi:MAG: hypothetical protein HY320_00095 [Armatimonadetes bacterium]|nr:hypothetical protein [Armatimonadota bacterium]